MRFAMMETVRLKAEDTKYRPGSPMIRTFLLGGKYLFNASFSTSATWKKKWLHNKEKKKLQKDVAQKFTNYAHTNELASSVTYVPPQS